MTQQYVQRPQAWEAMQLGPTPAQGDEFYDWAVSKLGEFVWPEDGSQPQETGVGIDLTTGKFMLNIQDDASSFHLWTAVEPGTWLIWQMGYLNPLDNTSFQQQYMPAP